MGVAAQCIGGALGLAALGCGLDPVDHANVFPNNCGEAGPVDVFDVGEIEQTESRLGPIPRVEQAGTTALVRLHSTRPSGTDVPDLRSEIWVVDECGRNPVLLYEGPTESATVYGTAGPHVLSCDESSGAMHWIDPTGDRPPRLLFPGVHDCRVFPSGRGLMAQKRHSGTVWYVADPSDPRSQLVVVTRDATVIDWDSYDCRGDFVCDDADAYGRRPRLFGDTVVVLLADDRLVQYDVRDGRRSVLSRGPVTRFGELTDTRFVAISHHLGSRGVLDRLSGEWTDACCLSGFEVLQQFGDWLVRGNNGPPTIPAPDEWANFRAWNLRSGATTEVVGGEHWRPEAQLSSDSLIVDVRPSWAGRGRGGPLHRVAGDRRAGARRSPRRRRLVDSRARWRVLVRLLPGNRHRLGPRGTRRGTADAAPQQGNFCRDDPG